MAKKRDIIITIDPDGTALHALGTATVSRTDQVSGATRDMDHASLHFRTDPVTGIAGYFDRSTAHLATEMPPSISVDPQVAVLHSGTDPVDSSKVSGPVNLLIGRVTGHVKEIGQRARLIPMKYR